LSRRLAIPILLAFALLAAQPARAQQETPPGPIYIVKEGDTLSSIALQFGIPLSELVAYNNLTDANQLFVGDRLVIPGLAGMTGVLETITVPFGENLRSLQRAYRMPLGDFQRLNHLVSPGELYKGLSLVVPVSDQPPPARRAVLAPGATLLEMAVQEGANPWALAESNALDTPTRLIPHDILLLPGGDPASPGALIPQVGSLEVNLLFQGEAAVLELTSDSTLQITGTLANRVFPFFREGSVYYGLQGVHALEEPGMTLLAIRAVDENGAAHSFSQMVKINERAYIFEYINVPPELIDPDTSDAENQLIASYLNTPTPDKLWEGVFEAPSPFADCINSTYGNRRSYNGSAFIYYHSGVDFCGGTGVKIFAPARGVVVFAGELEIRGNLTIIDHGWGVFTTYMHQSEILVETGDTVNPGDEIGLVGSTGRSTGPHLHWEVWVNGVAVNPLDWLAAGFP
jgi:murein DD-endopeptidase MepM/ murein hydrolase activator NlpD